MPDPRFQRVLISFMRVRGGWAGAAAQDSVASPGLLDLSSGGVASKPRVKLHPLNFCPSSNFVCHQFPVLNPFLLKLPRMVPSS